MYVGGGLGAVPYQAKLFDTFVPQEELMPLAPGRYRARIYAVGREEESRPRAP